MKKLWLIIPLLLTVLPVLLLPASAENQFVDFDFDYTSSSSNLSARNYLISYLQTFGYTTSDSTLSMDLNLMNSKGIRYQGSYNVYYNGSSLVLSGVVIGSVSYFYHFAFTSSDIDQYDYIMSGNYSSYCIANYRFVLDYFPTDVLSYFFYNFFENNYILWCCGIWVLAISFKLFFSRSGVRGCMNG